MYRKSLYSGAENLQKDYKFRLLFLLRMEVRNGFLFDQIFLRRRLRGRIGIYLYVQEPIAVKNPWKGSH